jgi:hypothetical protein
MPVRIAMPIAHVTGVAAYGGFYTQAGGCLIRVAAYFNQSTPRCEGIKLERDPAGPAAVSADWNLFAFTDGFLSFQDNSLVLRLPLELGNPPPVRPYNSGRLFGALRPRGPQLRHAVYQYPAAPPVAAVETKLKTLLNDATHPMRTIIMVVPTVGAAPQTLAAYITAAPGNVDLFLAQVMAGTAEMFVRAGEVIGNFETQSLELRFIDSCGNLVTKPAKPGGRPINPAFFLSLVRPSRNDADSLTMLTALPTAAPLHPLDFLLDSTRVLGAGAAADMAVVLGAGPPAKPLHLHIDVRDAAANVLATTGISMRGLGQWHQSRNAANPFLTNAPVRWRLRGNLAEDTNATQYGHMVTQAVAERETRLPGGINHDFTPDAVRTNRVQVYWTRYGDIFNAVAAFFEIPVELMLAIACAETSTGWWYDPVFANSLEASILRLEPLKLQPGVISIDPARIAILTNYMNMTGGIGGGGANPSFPIVWSGGSAVKAPNALTWNQLRDLINDFPAHVLVSPGIAQVLVGTAQFDLAWAEDFYGTGFIHTISISHNGVLLSADDLPDSLADIFEDWFAVSVDSDGNNTNVAGNVHAELTRIKRTLHGLIASGAHIKWSYNHGTTASNRICDFDLPTSFSGYNDGASPVDAAASTVVADDTPEVSDNKWKRIYCLLYNDKNYPQYAPQFYNAAATMFNAPGVVPLPSVRLWRG